MDESIYHWSVKVASSDCSNHQTIKLPTLMDYLQQAAWSNASQLGFSTVNLMENNITWVMNRMKITLHRLPSHNEVLDIETWPSGMNKYYTQRDFRVRCEGEVLVEASSNWLVMDINERKLIAIPDYIKEAGFVVDRGNLGEITGKLSYDPELSESQQNVKVSWFDLDLNNHVNNTKIYQWILEALGNEYLNTHVIKAIDILFKQEVTLDTELTTEAYYDASLACWKHALIETETNKVLVVATSRFE